MKRRLLMTSKHEELLRVTDLKTHFTISGGILGKNKSVVKAVDGVSFYLNKGETLGIVGESGCGKSTTGRSILQLIKPTSGSVKFKGEEVTNLKSKKLRNLRSEMQIVFQDPFASLNPRMTIESILKEALATHHISDNKKERR